MRIKKVILLVSFLLALSSVAYAQKGKLEGGVDTRMSFYDDDLSLVATGAQFGYGFTDWFSAGLRLESSVSSSRQTALPWPTRTPRQAFTPTSMCLSLTAMCFRFRPREALR